MSWTDNIKLVKTLKQEFDCALEWNKKIQLVRLANDAASNKNVKAFHQFVLEYIDNFDDHAFNILFSLVELIPEKMLPHLKFYTELYQKIAVIDYNTKFDFQTSMRIVLLLDICEQHLHIRNKLK